MSARLERLLLVLGVCLPIPLAGATGLSMPLPATVERIAAALVPWAEAATFEANEALPTGAAGTIVRAPGEKEAPASTRLIAAPDASTASVDSVSDGSGAKRDQGDRAGSGSGSGSGDGGGEGGSGGGNSGSGGSGGGSGTNPTEPGPGGGNDPAPDPVQDIVDTVDETAGGTVGGVVDTVNGTASTVDETLDGLPGLGG
jgi:hypothetical protein